VAIFQSITYFTQLSLQHIQRHLFIIDVVMVFNIMTFWKERQNNLISRLKNTHCALSSVIDTRKEQGICLVGQHHSE
jgi:hypothetical protein